MDDKGVTAFCGIEEILIFGDDSLEVALLLLCSSSPVDDCEYILLALVNKVVWFLLSHKSFESVHNVALVAFVDIGFLRTSHNIS